MTSPDPWLAWWWALVPEKAGQGMHSTVRLYLRTLTEDAAISHVTTLADVRQRLDLSKADVDYWLASAAGATFRDLRDRCRATVAAWVHRRRGTTLEVSVAHVGAPWSSRWRRLVQKAPTIEPPPVVRRLLTLDEGVDGAAPRRLVMSAAPVAGSPVLVVARLSCGHVAHRRTRSGTAPRWVFCEEPACEGMPSDQISPKPPRRSATRTMKATGLSQFLG